MFINSLLGATLSRSQASFTALEPGNTNPGQTLLTSPHRPLLACRTSQLLSYLASQNRYSSPVSMSSTPTSTTNQLRPNKFSDYSLSSISSVDIGEHDGRSGCVARQPSSCSHQHLRSTASLQRQASRDTDSGLTMMTTTTNGGHQSQSPSTHPPTDDNRHGSQYLELDDNLFKNYYHSSDWSESEVTENEDDEYDHDDDDEEDAENLRKVPTKTSSKRQKCCLPLANDSQTSRSVSKISTRDDCGSDGSGSNENDGSLARLDSLPSNEDDSYVFQSTHTLESLSELTFKVTLTIDRVTICWNDPVVGENDYKKYKVRAYRLHEHEAFHVISTNNGQQGLEKKGSLHRTKSISVKNCRSLLQPKLLTSSSLLPGAPPPERKKSIFHLLQRPFDSQKIVTQTTRTTPNKLQLSSTCLTNIYFDPSPLVFDAQVRVNQAEGMFHSQVIRFEVQRGTGPRTRTVGFADLDLASCLAYKQPVRTYRLPVMLYHHYNRRMMDRSERGGCNLSVVLYLNFECSLRDTNLSGGGSGGNNNNGHWMSGGQPVFNVKDVDLLRRVDSLPNLVQTTVLDQLQDPSQATLPYHPLSLSSDLTLLQSQPQKRHTYHLYRIAIHFGHLEHLVLPPQMPVSSVYACFEVKRTNHAQLARTAKRNSRKVQRAHQTSSAAVDNDRASRLVALNPLAIRGHRDTILARTQQLERCCFNEGLCANFDAHFTWHELFNVDHSPRTVLALVDDRGHPLFTYRANLTEFLACSSRSQYFHMKLDDKHRKGKGTGKWSSGDDAYCSLQFSIQIKRIVQDHSVNWD